MLCGRSFRSARDVWARPIPGVKILKKNGQKRVSGREIKKKARNGSEALTSRTRTLGHTASTTFKLDSEHSQSSGVDGLEGLTSSRALLGEESSTVVGVVC